MREPADDAYVCGLEARIAELEAIAREIIKAHRDVETGLEVPKYIYKMAVAAIEKP